MRARWLLPAGVLVLGLGLTWLGALGVSLRTAPLFDGVFLEDPYLWVDPPPGASGDPPSVETEQPVVNGSVPLLAVSTSEVPPQAQIIAQEDAFAITADAQSVTVSIVPSAPNDSTIAGNVYRFSVTDAQGASLEVRPAARVTIVIRAPQQNLVAEIAHFDGSAWVTIPTEFGGLPDLFAANITELGDYAVVITGPSPSGSTQPSVTEPSFAPASSGSGSGTGGDGVPIWVIAVLALGAIGVGLLWGQLGGRERN
jgi:hypothetical protein